MVAGLTVAQAFDQFRSKLELSTTLQDAVTTHHNAVRGWIESYGAGIETRLIGSLQRNTRIQPRSTDTFDIDILVVLGEFHQWVLPENGITPAESLDQLEKIIRGHEVYEKLGAESDSPTITFKYADGIRVELVPAWKDFIGDVQPRGRGYHIPKRNRWVLADYDHDAQFVSSENERSQGYLIPTIKMLKAAKRNLFPDMESYHLEVLAATVVPGIVSLHDKLRWPISYPRLVWGFFFLCKDQTLAEVKMAGSKSPPADAYMSTARKRELSSLFSEISDTYQHTLHVEGPGAVQAWSLLFGPPFPSAN